MISTLPKNVRDQLNRRLEAGEPEKPLIKWLNALTEVQDMLKSQFPDASITEIDLARWKSDGYSAWLRRQQTAAAMRTMAADVEDLAAAAPEPPAERLAQWLPLRYVAASRGLRQTTGDPEADWRRLRDFCADVATLRRLDQTAARLHLDRDKLEQEVREVRVEEEEEERRKNHKGGLTPETLALIEEAAGIM